MKKPKNVEQYIAGYPPVIRKMLSQMRATIRKAAPAATEVISYGMPAYKSDGMLLYFASHTSHLGFYPFTSAIKAFQKELAAYETSRGTVRFPFGKPLPSTLITKMVKFRMKENLEKAKLKKKPKKKTSRKAGRL